MPYWLGIYFTSVRLLFVIEWSLLQSDNTGIMFWSCVDVVLLFFLLAILKFKFFLIDMLELQYY